jgi:hypothetical protein
MTLREFNDVCRSFDMTKDPRTLGWFYGGAHVNLDGTCAAVKLPDGSYRDGIATSGELRAVLARGRSAVATDPKLDTNKPDITPLLTIPIEALAECARVRAFGVAKYGPENWRNVARGRWMAAALRHLACEVQSPGSCDPETGERHLAHVVVSVLLGMGVEP